MKMLFAFAVGWFTTVDDNDKQAEDYKDWPMWFWSY